MTPPAGPAATEATGSAVGILVTDNLRRGAEVQAERTVDGLRSLGWEVEFRSLASSAAPVVGARSLSRMHRSDMGRFDVSLVRPTRQFLGRQRIALAWGSLSIRYVAAAAVALRHRPRLGYVSIGSPRAWLSSRRAIGRYRLVSARYDFIIAVSEKTKQELVNAIGIPSSKITVIASGVPNRIFNLSRQPHDGATRVLFAGSLSPEKDPIAAVNAFARATNEADLRLRVVGDGPLRQAMQDLVEERGLEGTVEFTGSVPDIATHLAWADVLLLTSKTEGLPGVLIEAAAAALPTVAYDVGAVDEVVEHERSGFVIHDRTDESAARAIVALAADEELRKRLGDRGRDIANERFLIDAAVGRTDKLLKYQLR